MCMFSARSLSPMVLMKSLLGSTAIWPADGHSVVHTHARRICFKRGNVSKCLILCTVHHLIVSSYPGRRGCSSAIHRPLSVDQSVEDCCSINTLKSYTTWENCEFNLLMVYVLKPVLAAEVSFQRKKKKKTYRHSTRLHSMILGPYVFSN